MRTVLDLWVVTAVYRDGERYTIVAEDEAEGYEIYHEMCQENRNLEDLFCYRQVSLLHITSGEYITGTLFKTLEEALDLPKEER